MAPDVNGWANVDAQIQELGPPALVAGGHGGPYPATCTGLQAEFAELLQHVAEAALAAASPSGLCHTEQWWELLFLPPRLLLAAPAKETA